MTDRRTPRGNGEPGTRERGRRTPASDAVEPDTRAEADAAAAAEKARLEEEAKAEKARLDAEAAAAEQARRDEEARVEAEKARREAEEAAAAEQARHEQEAAAAAERARIAREEADAAVERARREQEAAAAAEKARKDEEARAEAERARHEAEAAAALEQSRRAQEEAAAAETARQAAAEAAEKARQAEEQAKTADTAEKDRQEAKKVEDEQAKRAKDVRQAEEDDLIPDTNLVAMKTQRALADANKPIEAATEAIWSMDPDKVKARKAVEEAYRTAARRGRVEEAAGELWTRYQTADEKFKSAAADMLRSRAPEWTQDKENESRDFKVRESHLWKWIDTFLAPKTEPAAGSEKVQVRKILRERKQVETRLMKTLGEREKARQEAAEKTKNWEKAFGRWSAPDKEIAALIASYVDRIDQLNADINTGTNRNQAIFSFWFEVAPVHLQLRDDTVTAENAPGVDLITKALEEFSDLVNKTGLAFNYQSGKDRPDGSLFLLYPGLKDPPDPSPLAAKRQLVLKSWKDAAVVQATAEAAYATRPDAAADLKPRHDKLKDDGWVKGTKEALVDPKKP